MNDAAIEQADLVPEVADWLRAVNDQVNARLARLNPAWQQSGQPDVARACAFGLLLGHLVGLYPDMRLNLEQVAETHPSFATLPAGRRLLTLRQLVADPPRAAAWLGPLVDLDDPQQIRQLFD